MAKIKLFFLFAFLISASFFLSSSNVYAQQSCSCPTGYSPDNNNQICFNPEKNPPTVPINCSNSSVVSNVELGSQPAGVKDLQALIQTLLNSLVALAFIALTGVLVWAGIKFLTSGGDQKQIQNAYDMITWAVIGIFFLALAWLIILLIENFTGVKVTQFCIGFDCS